MKIIQKLGLESFFDFTSDLSKVETVFIDIEASSLDTLTARLYLLSVNTGNEIYVFDFTKLTYGDAQFIVTQLQNKIVVGHNIKYDLKVLKVRTGIMLQHCWCTMIAELVINQGREGEGSRFASLATLVNRYCNIDLNKDIRMSFATEDLKDITQEQFIYASEDTKYLPIILDKQIELLKECDQLKIADLEMKIIPAVSSMELNGVILDTEKWKKLTEKSFEYAEDLRYAWVNSIINRLDLSQYKTALEVVDALCIPAKTKSLRGQLENVSSEFSITFIKDNFNIGSPKQVKSVLNLIGISLEGTGKKAIHASRSPDPILKQLLDYRSAIKKATSFGDNFIDKVVIATGRIHAQFNQLGAKSGRFSCEKPNLQQIVKDAEYRSCFLAPKGYKILSADYSQQELRLAGDITKEPKFIETYKKEDGDIHTLTASGLYKISVESVTQDQRRVGKGYNFALLYGIGEYGLSLNFDQPVEEARQFKYNFFKLYNVLSRVKTKLEDAIARRLYSVTLYGRKRIFEPPMVYSMTHADVAWEYASAIGEIKREGFNHIIQGTGADIGKLAIYDIDTNNPFGNGLKILMVVHDEIIFEVKEDLVEQAGKYITKCMLDAERPFLKEIPPAVEIHVGDCWTK